MNLSNTRDCIRRCSAHPPVHFFTQSQKTQRFFSPSQAQVENTRVHTKAVSSSWTPTASRKRIQGVLLFPWDKLSPGFKAVLRVSLLKVPGLILPTVQSRCLHATAS